MTVLQIKGVKVHARVHSVAACVTMYKGIALLAKFIIVLLRLLVPLSLNIFLWGIAS